MDAWVIEGSVDGKVWFELDRETGVIIEEEKAVQSFAMKRIQEVRIVRLRQIDFRPKGNDNIILSFFELFGDLQKT
jgi:hypothetical protein